MNDPVATLVVYVVGILAFVTLIAGLAELNDRRARRRARRMREQRRYRERLIARAEGRDPYVWLQPWDSSGVMPGEAIRGGEPSVSD